MSNSDSHSSNSQHHAHASGTPMRPAHQDFHWVDGPASNTPYANFVETTLDISAGLHTCLQIVYASDLERANNLDADSGQAVAPAVGLFESDQLLRLSIATTALLRDAARRRVEDFNEEVTATAAQA
jgi:hypothetical protein